MSACSIDRLLPHAGAMIVLDALIEIDGERTACSQPGLLVGTRRYHCHVDAFARRSELPIEAVRRFREDNGMAMFGCCMDAASARAEGQLDVFSRRHRLAFFTVTAQSPAHV